MTPSVVKWKWKTTGSVVIGLISKIMSNELIIISIGPGEAVDEQHIP